MKNKSKLYSWMPSALIGLALSTSVGFSAPVITANTYDASTSISGDLSWYGGAVLTWDGTQDHTGNAGGSVYISHAAAAGDHIYCYEDFSGSQWNLGTTHDLTLYTNMSIWVKWDTNYSTMPLSTFNATSGGMGGLRIALNDNGGYSGANAHGLPPQQIPDAASNGWVHLNFPIVSTIPNINQIGAFIFDTGNYHSSPWVADVAFWVDDITFDPSSVTTLPPPTLAAPAKAVSGFNVFASTAGLYDRQSAMLVANTGKSWVGQATVANPVTYSFTIKSFPSTPATYGCEAYLFLVPDPNANDNAPDWNETNCVIAYIQLGSTDAILNFRYKTGEDHQNAMYNGGSETRTSATETNNYFYTAAPGSLPGGAITNVVSPGVYNITNETGNLGSVSNAMTAVGTWTIKFTSDTNVTLMAPDGNTSSFVIPPHNVGYFAGNTSFNVYLGMQANNAATLNQAVVYSNFAISNTANPFPRENFLTDTVLDTNIWNNTVASGTAGVRIVPASAAYWVNWTLPDGGFSLATGSNLFNMPAWTSPAFGPILTLGGAKSQLVDRSELPAGGTAFFNLIKRSFTQLQVLLPGETNAPGTVSGKIGTPLPATSAVDLVTVTVYAVDATWHRVNSPGDVIHLTSTTDGAAITSNDSALVNGATTAPILFNTAGSQTVTATDITNTNIPPSTSSLITVH